ncbi:O-acyltransferase like protein-like [Haliotis asinina]|uniref:O-acyltransferase like protein-like n=1 Tax=Haliotis asinina TaxID=109174 RepID=UPI003531FDB3
MEFSRLFLLFCVLSMHRTSAGASSTTDHRSSLPNSTSMSGSETTQSVTETSPQSVISLSNSAENTSSFQPATTTSPVTTTQIPSNTTTQPLSSIISGLYNTFLNVFMNSISNTTSPTTQKLPLSVLSMQNKLPEQMRNSLLPLLMEGGTPDLESITRIFKNLTDVLPSILKVLLPSNTSGLTTEERTCSEDMDTYLTDLLQMKMWALNMFDASGKPGTAIMEGAMTFFGNFDECLDGASKVDPATGREIKGDTCVVSISPPSQMLAMMDAGGGGGGNDIIDALGGQLAFNWHLCLPRSCGSRMVQSGLQNRLSQVNLTVARVMCHSEIKNGPVSNDSGAVGAIVLTAILGCMVLLGSGLDLYIRATKDRRRKVPLSPRKDEVKLTEIFTTLDHSGETTFTNGKIDTNGLIENPRLNIVNGGIDNPAGPQVQETNGGHLVFPNGGQQPRTVDKERDQKYKPKLLERVLLCFSAVSNGEKILSVKRSPASITCLHGIRVLSIGWVILGHTYIYTMSNAGNPKSLLKLIKGFSFQIMMNATLSVDSFFVLSGLLVTYLFLKETEKAGGLKVKHMVMYYVHRYLRLTPVYAYAMFVYTFLVSHLADGPTWVGPYDKKSCETHWWTSLLYINNVYEPAKQCMGWGWYLANDMQFYVVAPLALVPWALSPTRAGTTAGKIFKAAGITVVIGYLICSVATTASLVHKYNVDLFTNPLLYFDKVYQKPWCRIGTFAIGMMLGYILHALKSRDVKMSPFLQGVGWLLALVAAGACTLSTYDANAEGRPGWGVEARTAHETLYRPVWGLILAWVIFMCCKGKAGIVDWMLSWDWWQPLSRLTYGAYLVHLMFIQTETATARSLFNFTSGYIVYRFFGYTCMSFIFSFLLAILVEAPLLQLEKLLLS